MKISRVKAFLFILGLIPFVWICWEQSLNIINDFNNQSKLIKVSGAINDASSLAGFALFGGIFILFSIGFVTGRTLTWIPKIVFIAIGIITIISFFLGWGMNVALKEKLYEQGYIECTSEREFTLKYSSKTYVLPPETCD